MMPNLSGIKFEDAAAEKGQKAMSSYDWYGTSLAICAFVVTRLIIWLIRRRKK
jgi:hypothetical protein